MSNSEVTKACCSEVIKCCNSCQAQSQQLLRCARCKLVYYCDQGCQIKDWNQHKRTCKPVEIITKQETKPNPEKQKHSSSKKVQGLNQFGKLVHVGSGNFSEIFKTTSKVDGKLYAIKQIEKAKVKRMRKQADVLMEKHCLTKLNECDYVVRMYKTFQDDLNLYFQMEFPENGELWERSKTFGIIPQSLYKYFTCQVVRAVAVLHNDYNIVHRDLKPENILLDSENRIKLIDFGTAKDLDRPDLKGSGNGLKGKKPFEHYVGTAHYMAPQCIHNKASEKKSDIYSLSGVLYFLRVGSPPFQGGSEYLTFTKSLETKLLTCPQLFEPQLQDLIGKMNNKTMSERPDINQVMKHPYFKEIDFSDLQTYSSAIHKVTEEEIYFENLSKKLIKIMDSEKEPKLQTRQRMYDQSIKPIFEEQKSIIETESSNNKLAMLHLQCMTFLNLHDNNDISFSELYKRQKEGVTLKTSTEEISNTFCKEEDSASSDSSAEKQEAD